MKKLFSILLLATMLLYSVGYYVAYKYNRKVIKREMRSAIASGNYKPDELFTIEIPLVNNEPEAKDFKKVDKHEFLYHGEMYDIVSTKMQQDKVVYSCISDKEETHIMAVFSEQVQKLNDHPVTGKKTASLIKFSVSPFTVSESVSITDFQVAILRISTPVASCKLSKAYQNIPSPPPWQI